MARLTVVVALFLTWASSGLADGASERAVQAQQGFVSRSIVPDLVWQTTPCALTESERQHRQAVLDNVNLPVPIPEGPTPPVLFELPPSAPATPSDGATAAAPGDLMIQKLSSLGNAAPAGSKGTITEGTVGGFGSVLIQSGNWYLAVSLDGGTTWTHLDPYSIMAGVDDGFCCDQVVRYEPSRDLLLVVLQSVQSTSTNRNTLRLLVFQGLRAAIVPVVPPPAVSVFSYDFTPQQLGFPAGQWYDYPKMTLGKNNLYITANRFAPVGPPSTFQGSTIMRLPLDPLKAGAMSLPFSFHIGPEFTLLVAEGSGDSDTAYWGSSLNTSQLRIFSWAESSGTTILQSDIAVATWNNAALNCTGPDGLNFAGRADHRLQIAVFSNRWDGVDGKQLLFGQASAAQPSSGRPFAYTRITRIAVSTLTPIDTVDLAFNNACAIYASGTANSQGGVGVSAFMGGGTFQPTHIVCVKDEFGGSATAPFQCVNVRASTNGPINNSWGDYTHVDPLFPTTCAYRTAGWVLIGGSQNDNVDPHYVSFGRTKCFP